MKPFWPTTTEALPLEGSRFDESVGYKVVFRLTNYERVKAIILHGMVVIDVIYGENFDSVYKTVHEEYPQASWNPYENK